MTSEDALKIPNRLELAQQLFRSRYARCFWHMKPDLVITEDNIPLVVKGLRVHGGREEMLLADRLANWRQE